MILRIRVIPGGGPSVGASARVVVVVGHGARVTVGKVAVVAPVPVRTSRPIAFRLVVPIRPVASAGSGPHELRRVGLTFRVAVDTPNVDARQAALAVPLTRPRAPADVGVALRRPSSAAVVRLPGLKIVVAFPRLLPAAFPAVVLTTFASVPSSSSVPSPLTPFPASSVMAPFPTPSIPAPASTEVATTPTALHRKSKGHNPGHGFPRPGFAKTSPHGWTGNIPSAYSNALRPGQCE